MRVLFLPLVLGAVATGCSLGCTDQGCVATVRFAIDPASVQDDIGEPYTFQMSIDELSGRCDGIIGEAFSCTSNWEVLLDDNGLPTDIERTRSGLLDEVVLDVDRDGQAVFSEAFDADGDGYFPNGRRCGGGCEGFSADVTW